MAIDPSIALGFRPPVIAPLDIQSPLEKFAKIQSLRNLMQQGEEGQLVLQQRRLAIEQAQREEQERKNFADYLAKHLGPDAPAAGAMAPVETPPAAPLPAAAGTQPAATAFDASGAEPQPGGPGALLSTLITSPVVRPSPPPAPLPVRGATAPAPEGGGFNIGEILTKFPRLGPAFVKSQVELDKSRHETAIKQAEAAGKTAEGLGRIALSIRDSKDPAAQFTTGVLQAVSQGLMPPAMGRQMVAEGYDKHRNDIQAFIDQAQNVKDTHETRRIELQTYGEAVQNASKTVDAVGNQAQYTSWLADQPARLQQALGPTYSPQLKATIQSMGVSRADVPGMLGKRLAAAAQILEPARARGDDAYRTALADFPQDIQDAMGDAKTPLEVRQRALTAEQRTTAQQAADTAAETKRQHEDQNKIAQQHLNIARRADTRAEQIYQNTYGPGANEALVGVDPKLRVQATNNAQNAANEYAKAVESTGNMQSIIDLARSGNKIAYAYAPTTGVLTINTASGVKRVNMPEIKSYGGAGSAMDNIEGWLGKQTTGASIPKNILDNMEQVNKAISDSAAGTYNTKLSSINQNYHANFKPAVKAATGSLPEINSQAAYDALPKGAQYKNNGEVLTKK